MAHQKILAEVFAAVFVAAVCGIADQEQMQVCGSSFEWDQQADNSCEHQLDQAAQAAHTVHMQQHGIVQK